MRARRGWIVLAFAFLIWFVGEAAAGKGGTGGRMGGGSWGKSSSSSSSSRSSSSSSSSRSYSSSSSSRSYSSSSSGSRGYSSSSSSGGSYSSSGGSYSYSSSGGGGGLPAGGFFFVLLVGGGLAAIVLIARSSSGGGASYDSYASAYVPVDAVDVTVLRIALDGRARKFVQTELGKIAQVADTSTEEGRLAMLRDVTLMLRRVRDAWVYGGAVNEPMRDIDAAKTAFDHHVDDARARFSQETISNVQGQKLLAPAGDYTPRSDEGAGLILVSIIVAARTELFTVAHIGDGEDLRKALEAASHRPASDLVAIEIVWQPSEENDRLSSMELEAKYPHPELIPITGALVGKTFCTYCGGPFPAELVSCPHCGAPAREEPEPRAA